MNKAKFFTGIAFALVGTLYGCSDSSDVIVESGLDTQNIGATGEFYRPEAEAKEVASRFFSKNNSRAIDATDLRVDIITSSGITPRSRANEDDTIAYLITPQDSEQGGFVMVSADTRLPQLLAFSEAGPALNNGAVPTSTNGIETSFFDAIDKYLKYQTLGDGYLGFDFPDSDNIFDHKYSLCPRTTWWWDQNEETYNKYVVKAHPNCIPGGDAFATSLISVYCRDSITISGTNFNLYAIRYGMNHQTWNGIGEPGPIGPSYPINQDGTTASAPEIYMNLAQCCDKVAQMMEIVGRPDNLGLTYIPRRGTFGDSKVSYNWFKKHGFTMANPAVQTYIPEEVAEHIKNGNIVYMEGEGYITDYINSNYYFDKRHAWVIDGCCYDDTIVSGTKYKKNVFVHCNFGEDTFWNGYYWGGMFLLTQEYAYWGMNYFAVKPTREYGKLD